jgi:hypothetical protein
LGYDAIILLERLTDRVGETVAWAVRFRERRDEALQMSINEAGRVPRQSTSVFETRNFSTPLWDKRPLQDGNIMERN